MAETAQAHDTLTPEALANRIAEIASDRIGAQGTSFDLSERYGGTERGRAAR